MERTKGAVAGSGPGLRRTGGETGSEARESGPRDETGVGAGKQEGGGTWFHFGGEG
jgi:hypothetical protein